MIYKVNDEEFTNIDDVIKYCIDDEYYDENESDFEEWMNDTYENADIDGHTYHPYDIVRNCDEYALNDLRTDWANECVEADKDNAQYELEHAQPGNHVYIQRYVVEVKETTNEDCDGDNVLAETKKKLEQAYEQIRCQQMQAEQEETDFMKIFQVIE